MMRHRPIVWFAVCWTIGAGLALEGIVRSMPLAGAVICGALLIVCYLLAIPGRLWIGGVLMIGLSLGYNAWYDARNVSELTRLGDGMLAVSSQPGMAEEQQDEPKAATGAGTERAGEPPTESAATAQTQPATKSLPPETGGGGPPEDRLDKLPIRVRGAISSPVSVDGDRVSFTVQAREAAIGEGELVPLDEALQVSIRLASQPEQDTARAWRQGDGVAFAGELRRPSPARNFGGFDYRRYLYRQHIHWQAAVKGAGGVAVAPPELWSAAHALRLLDELRGGLGDRLERWYGPLHGGFMKSLLLGIRDDFDPEQLQQFSRLGLTHILAISGLHVAVVLGGLALLLRWLRVTKETNLTVCMVFVPLYVVVTGASPSVVRSGIMALLALYAIRAGIQKDALHLAAMAAIVMLAVQPYYLFDVGCQLSFLVTAGLIIGVPRFQRIVRLRPKWWADAVAVTTVAQILSFPITIYYFNQFSLLSWLANLLLVPLYSFLILPLGMFSLTLGLMWDPLGGWIAWPTVQINAMLGWGVELIAGWRWGATIWASPPPWWLAVYFLLAAGLYWALRVWRERGQLLWGAAAGCSLIFLLFFAYHPDMSAKSGSVEFIDVGQGDAILVRTPEHRTMLIDGGGTLTFSKPGEEWRARRDPYEVGRKLLVPLLKQRGVYRIDWLLVSHEDTDHIGGLQAVLEEIPVRRMLFNGTLKPGETAEKLFATALERKVALYAVRGGETLTLDKYTQLDILPPSPAARTTGGEADDASPIRLEKQQNEHSIAALLTLYGRTFLFPGDLGAAGERNVLQTLASTLPQEPAMNGRNAPSAGVLKVAPSLDVLKVGHHGSKSSTTTEWLDFWQPRNAVISVGAFNSYGHPAPQVVERLTESGAAVRRTDRDGEVRMLIDPSGEMRIDEKL